MKDPDQKDKASLKRDLNDAKAEIEHVGGLAAFKSGDWFFNLVQKCFRNYYERATGDYFSAKYPGFSEDKLLSKISSVAARNAAILGGLVGLGVSVDEVAAFFTAPATAGLSVPAQVAIAATAIAAELLLLTRMQLKLVAEIAKIMKVPLDPEDPEDILTIFAFAVGGGAAEAAGKFGMKVGAKVTEKVIRATIKKETLAALKKVAANLVRNFYSARLSNTPFLWFRFSLAEDGISFPRRPFHASLASTSSNAEANCGKQGRECRAKLMTLCFHRRCHCCDDLVATSDRRRDLRFLNPPANLPLLR